MKPWAELTDSEKIARTAATGELYFWLAIVALVVAWVALVVAVLT